MVAARVGSKRSTLARCAEVMPTHATRTPPAMVSLSPRWSVALLGFDVVRVGAFVLVAGAGFVGAGFVGAAGLATRRRTGGAPAGMIVIEAGG